MFRQYLAKLMGDYQQAGNETIFHCPFCAADGADNTKFKLYVETEPDSDKFGIWHCFKCERHGGPAKLVMMLNHISYGQAKQVLDSYNFNTVDLTKYDDSLTIEEQLLIYMNQQGAPGAHISQSEPLKAPPLPIGYKQLSKHLDDPRARPYIAYCNRRGFTLADINRHAIGFVEDGSTTRDDGRLVPVRNSLVFLTFNNEGKYIYWNTRAIDNNPVKSLNCPELPGCYSKKTVLFNLNNARNYMEIVFNEGVPDALTVGVSGIASFGKYVTDDQIKLLVDNIQPQQKVYLLQDMDAKKQMLDLGKRLSAKHPETYFVTNPTNRDANDLGNQRIWEIIHRNATKVGSLSKINLLLA